MKTDFYTKAVLTVIAVCLTVIVLKQVEIIPSAHADAPKTNSAPNKQYALVPLNADGSIDVNIKSTSSKMDVNIAGVGTSDKLNVAIREVQSGAFSYTKLPVKIEDVSYGAFSNAIPVKISK